jgi:hypothetical protein
MQSSPKSWLGCMHNLILTSFFMVALSFYSLDTDEIRSLR